MNVNARSIKDTTHYQTYSMFSAGFLPASILIFIVAVVIITLYPALSRPIL